jgi:SAM-dependent methyltransferase
MRCIVCQKAIAHVVWKENGYEGLSCECGTVCTSPIQRTGTIDPTEDGHSDIFYSAYAPQKARWINKIKPGGRLLEVGCGEGHFLVAAKSVGYEVAGIEAHRERAERTAKRIRGEVRCGLLETLDRGSDRFDIVYHCDLLSHFADPIKSLRTMQQYLSPDGILAFEAGTLGGINPFWYRLIGGLGFPQHRWLYSERSLRKMLETAGLRIIKMRHFGLAPTVALHYLHFAAGKLFRKMYPQVFGTKHRADASSVSSHTSSAQDWSDSVEQFFRYRIGSLAPRIGPATWLIAAAPGRGRLS